MKLWDVAARRAPSATSEVSKDNSRCAAFSPDGELLATGTASGALTLWKPGSVRPWKSFQGQHSDVVRSVAFSPDGNLLETCGQDRKITVRETANWTVLKARADLPQPILSSAISPDGTLLAVAMGNPGTIASPGGVRLYDLATLDVRLELSDIKSTTWSVAFSPDGKTLATSSGQLLRLWDANTGEPRGTLDAMHLVRIVAFSPDGKLLLSAGMELFDSGGGSPSPCPAMVWDVATLGPRAMIKAEGKPILGASFSPDGTRIATASVPPRDVLVWEIAKMPALPAAFVRAAGTAVARAKLRPKG